jgi:hypothetical protein
VAKFSLRRYETQAAVSVGAAVAAAVMLGGLTFLVMQHFDFGELALYYGPTRRMVILAATAVTLLVSVIGFGFGINSVGQRRNEQQNRSWLGFFVSAVVFCLTLVVFALFFFRGESARF